MSLDFPPPPSEFSVNEISLENSDNGEDDDAPLNSLIPGNSTESRSGRGGSFRCAHTCEGSAHQFTHSWRSQKPKLLHEVSIRSHRHCTVECTGYALLSHRVPCIHNCSACSQLSLSHYSLVHAAQTAKHPLCHEDCPGWPYHAGIIKNLNVVKLEKIVREKKIPEPKSKGKKRKSKENENSSDSSESTENSSS